MLNYPRIHEWYDKAECVGLDKIKALFHRQRKVNEKVERKARDVEIWNIGRKMER